MDKKALIVILLAAMIMILVLILAIWSDKNDASLTYEKCCGGNMCSDTYYDAERDVCVLTLCHPILSGIDCTYKPG